MLSRWVGARSSRCLFGGYRFESPLAGFDSATFAGPGELQPMCRQSGYNFAGLHYTLHRHYDPRLMRFTSIDPAASPVYNLYAYSNNSPARFFDPDGLDYSAIWDNMKVGDLTGAASEYWNDITRVKGRVSQNTKRYNEEGWDQYAKDVGTASAGYAAGVADNIYLGDAARSGFAAMGVNTESQLFSYGRTVGTISGAIVLGAVTGGTGTFARGVRYGSLALDATMAGVYAAQGDFAKAGMIAGGHALGFGMARLGRSLGRGGGTIDDIGRTQTKVVPGFRKPARTYMWDCMARRAEGTSVQA